jgi:Flp pilus assembly protein TadB
MKQFSLVILIYMSCISLVTAQVTGSEGKTAAQSRKEIRNVKKENEKAAIRAKKYGKERHLSIQDKATRKRMKKNLKRANKTYGKRRR